MQRWLRRQAHESVLICRPLKRALLLLVYLILGWRPDSSGLPPGYPISRLQRENPLLVVQTREDDQQDSQKRAHADSDSQTEVLGH